jgi:hypothetical protein
LVLLSFGALHGGHIVELDPLFGKKEAISAARAHISQAASAQTIGEIPEFGVARAVDQMVHSCRPSGRDGGKAPGPSPAEVRLPERSPGRASRADALVGRFKKPEDAGVSYAFPLGLAGVTE